MAKTLLTVFGTVDLVGSNLLILLNLEPSWFAVTLLVVTSMALAVWFVGWLAQGLVSGPKSRS